MLRTPLVLQLGMRSLILLMLLRRLVFPQPEGPMMAVTMLDLILREMSLSTWLSPYQRLKPLNSMMSVEPLSFPSPPPWMTLSSTYNDSGLNGSFTSHTAFLWCLYLMAR